MEISKKKMKRIVIALTAIILVCAMVVALVLIFDKVHRASGNIAYLTVFYYRFFTSLFIKKISVRNNKNTFVISFVFSYIRIVFC